MAPLSVASARRKPHRLGVNHTSAPHRKQTAAFRRSASTEQKGRIQAGASLCSLWAANWLQSSEQPPEVPIFRGAHQIVREGLERAHCVASSTMLAVSGATIGNQPIRTWTWKSAAILTCGPMTSRWVLSALGRSQTNTHARDLAAQSVPDGRCVGLTLERDHWALGGHVTSTQRTS